MEVGDLERLHENESTKKTFWKMDQISVETGREDLSQSLDN